MRNSVSKNIYTVPLAIVCIIMFAGCEKYLDVKSDNTLIVPTTLADLQSLLDNGAVMNNQTAAFMEASSDDYFVTDEVLNSVGTDMNSYIWKDQIYTFAADWAKPYLAIYNTNLCLEQIEKVEKGVQNESQWNNIYGSSLFFRSFHFLNLIWTYSKAYDATTANEDLGIVLRLGSDFNVPSVRTSVGEGYRQIIKDLMIANEYLPDNPSVPLRPSKAASYGLLARAYLSMRVYDSAFKYSNLSLNIKSDLMDFNSSADVVAGNIPFKAYPYNKEVIFYTMMGTSFSIKAPVNALIDSTLYASYVANDKRKGTYFRPNGAHQRFKGSYASHATNLFTGLAVDEMYLIRAESRARIGSYMDGLADLNILLQKRWVTGQFVPFAATNKEEALAIILRERRKELLMRGQRWADIKRLNKEGANIIPTRKVGGQTYTLSPNDNRYALPLPEDIIKLTGIPQNIR